jgi:hypothetical protein
MIWGKNHKQLGMLLSLEFCLGLTSLLIHVNLGSGYKINYIKAFLLRLMNLNTPKTLVGSCLITFRPILFLRMHVSYTRPVN